MAASQRQKGPIMPMNVPSRADQATARPRDGMRLSNSRMRLQGRSSRRFWPKAMSDQSAMATVGIPMPWPASRLIAIASAAAPSTNPGTGPLFQSDALSSAAASQLAPRISQREKSSSSKGLSQPKRTTKAQPEPAQIINQPARAGGASSGWSSMLGWGRSRASRRSRRRSRRLERSGGFECGRRLGRTEEVPEGKAQSQHQADESPDAGGGPHLEEQVMGIDDFFACLGQLIFQVRRGEIAGAHAPPERGRLERTRERGGTLGDDAPGAAPVFQAVAERLRRLREDQRIEPAGRQAGDDQSGDHHAA